MIAKENFDLEHIKDLRERTMLDPILLERILYAFGLLEAITLAKLPFIFKGGTRLMLLLEHPHRLSTDIDILVEPGTDIDAYIYRASQIFPFKSVEEQHRIGKSGIEKRHFKFQYDSPNLNSDFYILLDVVFAHSPYMAIVNRPIKNEFLLTEGENSIVQIPNIDCILGDKLTAFAPHTTGIGFDKKKELEIIKQFFDVANLIDFMKNQTLVTETYSKTVQEEIQYRGLNISKDDVLQDTINTAACFIDKGFFNQDEYKLLMSGIKSIRPHIIGQKYSGEIAAIDACKIIYLAACIFTDTEFKTIIQTEEYATIVIENARFRKMNYMKKRNIVAYGYLTEAIRLLEK
jgi:hypothetical protein